MMLDKALRFVPLIFIFCPVRQPINFGLRLDVPHLNKNMKLLAGFEEAHFLKSTGINLDIHLIA
jgi:hypothetical protein